MDMRHCRNVIAILCLLTSCALAPDRANQPASAPAAAAPPAAPAPAAPAAPSTAPAPAPTGPVIVAGVTAVEHDLVLRDFAFASGEKLPELRMHVMTLGTLQRDAKGRATNAVLIMHGTTGSGRQFLRPQFADELFGPGQPLDLRTTYVILPDDIGHGGSSKPSDGLRTRFPRYGYHDMVAAEHAIVGKLGVDHLRLVMGTSMGCMHAWMWAEKWPRMMDAVLPLACLPVQIAGRNRQWRKMIIDAIQEDPDWKGGDYTTPPRAALQLADAILTLASSSPIADQKRMPTREEADRVTAESKRPPIDASDLLYALSSSSDYDPSPDLEKIVAPLILINSADDFINPPELGIAEREIRRVKKGRYILIPASEATRGHGTHTWAALWKKHLVKLLAATARPARTPRRAGAQGGSSPEPRGTRRVGSTMR
jgi:homoserine O-acetyltransferase